MSDSDEMNDETSVRSPTQAAVACTLAAGDFEERVAWIAELNRQALRDCHRDKLRLELTYAPTAAEQVREMVRRERDCCAFLRFRVREDADAIRLTIEVPDTVGEGAELLLQPFQATVDDTTVAARRGAST